MATLADSAAELGVTPDSEDGLDPELMKPVRLSPTTRRQVSMTTQDYVDTASMPAEIDSDIQAELLARDAAEDAAWTRDVDQKLKAVEWNNKVLAQEHASAVLEDLGALLPTDPEYQVKKAGILSKYPMATMDPRVVGVLEVNEKAYQTIEANRDEARKRQQSLEDRAASAADQQRFRIENREDQQAENRDNRAQTFEDQVSMNLPRMSKAARDVYAAGIAAGKNAREAFQEAAMADTTVQEKRQFASFVQTRDSLDQQIAELNKKTILDDTDKAKLVSLSQQRDGVVKAIASYGAEEAPVADPAAPGGPTTPPPASSAAKPAPKPLRPTSSDSEKAAAAAEATARLEKMRTSGVPLEDRQATAELINARLTAAGATPIPVPTN